MIKADAVTAGASVPLASLPDHGPDHSLRDALLDSRKRWRDFVGLASDVAFETDHRGDFSFITPDPVLGWSADMLIGKSGDMLLATTDPTVFNPFRPQAPQRHRRAWLRRPDGSTVCLSFSIAPLVDAAGTIIGARGVGVDVNEQDRIANEMAGALRRCEVIDYILRHMRAEVLAPRMMQAALDALVRAVGAAGAVIADPTCVRPLGTPPASSAHTILHRIGDDPNGVLDIALHLLQDGIHGGIDSTVQAATTDGQPILVCPCPTRFGGLPGLVLWRGGDRRAWDGEDIALVNAACTILRMLLEHESIQGEMSRQARTDSLTGLPNRRSFFEEVTRRIERLDRNQESGTLMYVDLDNFKQLNDQLGHETGDRALRDATELLRRTVRPADLVARLGGDEFAVWMDGADELTAAERADALRRQIPTELTYQFGGIQVALSMSIGIATRRPESPDDVEALMRQADQAMYDVKRTGRGNWRVWRAA
jgi:diguanylate cyclase (GGDEF)-like protein/PAS domain S-box-containing protein